MESSSHSLDQAFDPVLPKPPFLTPAASSSTVIPYSKNIPCAKPLPADTSNVLPSFDAFVIFIKICFFFKNLFFSIEFYFIFV